MITNAEVIVPAADWEAALREIAAVIQRLGEKEQRVPGEGFVRGSLTALMFPVAEDPERL